MRALKLLAEFIDLGTWAVNMCLNVGTQPYMLKLLSRFARGEKMICVYVDNETDRVDALKLYRSRFTHIHTHAHAYPKPILTHLKIHIKLAHTPHTSNLFPCAH